MRIRIDDWNDDGRGRGTSGKRAILVSQAHPGEEVTVRVDRTTRGAVQGRVARLVSEPVARVETPCRHAFHCTGCPFLCADEATEAAFKRGRVTRALAAVPGCTTPDDALRPGEPYGYRHFAKQVVARRGRRVFLGSYVTGTHHPTDNAGCPVLVPALAEALDELATLAGDRDVPVHEPSRQTVGLRYVTARYARKSAASLIVLVTSDPDTGAVVALARELFERRDDVASVWVLVNASEGNVLLEGEPVHIAGVVTVEEELLGHTHPLGPRSFFQVNPVAAEVMFDVARSMAGEGARVLEGYAGVGALTLPLAERFEQVVAVESHPEAHALLVLAAAGRNVDPRCGDADALIPELLRDPWDAVVLDPPRRGLGEPVVAALAARGPARVVLLSCDPATLARDLPALVGAGYRADRIVPVDQFPRTAHIETVTLLVRDGGRRGDS